MELHERLSTVRPAPIPIGRDPFAEVKNRIHLAVIGELGPQLFNVSMDPNALRERVADDIKTHLGDEQGLSRDDRDRIAAEIADDILAHGPLERLLADDSVTEIMVNGPYDVWVERQGRLYETTVRFTDESHLRRIINKIVGRATRRRIVADGGCPSTPTEPRQRIDSSAVAQRAAAHHPQVQQEAP
jgi:pilus assembly protein CpaF